MGPSSDSRIARFHGRRTNLFECSETVELSGFLSSHESADVSSISLPRQSLGIPEGLVDIFPDRKADKSPELIDLNSRDRAPFDEPGELRGKIDEFPIRAVTTEGNETLETWSTIEFEICGRTFYLLSTVM